jgi:hypothetical protein
MTRVRSRCKHSGTSCSITGCLGTTRRFLEQRVEINYFAAALLIPERGALTLLRKAKAAKDIAIEDLRDAYAVSYETAAHRFTNLATRRLDVPVHFMRIASTEVIYKAYENDGVHLQPMPPAPSRDSGSAATGRRLQSSTGPMCRRRTTSTPTPHRARTGAPR